MTRTSGAARRRSRWTFHALVSIAVLGSGMSVLAPTSPASAGPISCTSVTVMAHRGLHDSTADENTVDAFADAAHDGLGIETDLRLTRDGVPVLFHDKRVDKLTNGHGPVSSLRYRKLSRLRTQHGSQIPTLDQLLATLAPYPGIQLQIELKVNVGRQRLGRMLRQVLSSGFGGRLLITSTKLNRLRTVRQVAPGIPTGFITYHQVRPRLRVLKQAHVSRAMISGNLVMQRPRFVAAAQSRGIGIQARYLDPSTAASLGIDRVTSNVPYTCPDKSSAPVKT